PASRTRRRVWTSNGSWRRLPRGVERRIRILAAGWIARPCAIAACAAATVCYAQQDPEPFSIADSLTHGRFTMELRPRYNHIEESNYTDATDGYTARVRLGWITAPYHGFRATIEGINTSHPGYAHFNDDPAHIADSPYPLLPDPK